TPRRVGGHLVSGHEGVVPEEMKADAGTEPKVDEEDREDAALVLGTEGEEVEDGRAPVALLRSSGDRAYRNPDDVLRHQIDGDEHDPRDPDEDVPGGGRRRLLAAVVGNRT